MKKLRIKSPKLLRLGLGLVPPAHQHDRAREDDRERTANAERDRGRRAVDLPEAARHLVETARRAADLEKFLLTAGVALWTLRAAAARDVTAGVGAAVLKGAR